MSLLASAGTALAAGSSALVDASGNPSALGIFASEFFGTFILILLGAGVCAAVTLKKSYAKDAGWVVITFGWGLAVFTAVYLSFLSGAHLSPAVTVGLATAGRDLATGVPATPERVEPTSLHPAPIIPDSVKDRAEQPSNEHSSAPQSKQNRGEKH